MNRKPVSGERWIYKQSLRTYKVISVVDGNVNYTPAQPMYESSGKTFTRTLTEFIEAFVHPDDMNDDVIHESSKRQMELLKKQGII